MWMGYIKSSTNNVISLLSELDQIAPSWQWANQDHAVTCCITRLRALDTQITGGNYPVEVWAIIPDKTQAMTARLTFNFAEFGKAAWSESRKVRNSYQYSGNGLNTVPGYVIK